jgi:predicted nucleotidyltransferase
MDTRNLLEAHKKEILEIAARHGVTSIQVFGSTVRGESKPGSDIDFLVEVGPVHSAWFPAGLIADLEDLLGVPVDVVTKSSLHWYIRESVLQEARPL